MWLSLEEYLANVRPASRTNHRGLWRLYQMSSSLQRAIKLTRHYDDFRASIAAMETCHRLADAQGARRKFRDAAIEAEQLFFFSEALARLSAADDVISEFDLLNHLERYATNEGDSRVLHEIENFVGYAQEFIAAAEQHFIEVGAFAVDGVIDLPEEVRGHFHMARHLISIEAYEMGMLSALRGLEGTLRLILRRNRVTHARLRDGSTLNDLIDAGRHFRWARGGQAVLPERTAVLLQFLRVARNAAAHSDSRGDDDWQENTRLALSHARRLWESSQNGRRKMVAPPERPARSPRDA